MVCQNWEAVVGGMTCDSDVIQQGRRGSVDVECLDLQGDLETKMDQREDNVGGGEFGEGEAFPLELM